MAAEISPISEITDGNQAEFFQVPDHSPLPEGAEWVRHSSSYTADVNADLHAEVHEALRILLRLEAVLVRFEPLLSQFGASPLATRRALRKAGRDGG